MTEPHGRETPFGYLLERCARLIRLCERLGVSTDPAENSETQMWALVGQVLAQGQEEFSDFPIFDGTQLPKPGRPLKEELGEVLLAEQVDAHRAAFPAFGTTKAALEDLKAKGMISGATISSLQKSVSKGRQVLRQREMDRIERERAWQMQADARLKEGRRRDRLRNSE